MLSPEHVKRMLRADVVFHEFLVFLACAQVITSGGGGGTVPGEKRKQ